MARLKVHLMDLDRISIRMKMIKLIERKKLKVGEMRNTFLQFKFLIDYLICNFTKSLNDVFAIMTPRKVEESAFNTRTTA